MITKLISLWAGNLKVDGGALFGVIPKVVWNKQMQCDKDNFVLLTIRCLLIDQGHRKILIETGAGNHYSEKFRQIQGLSDGQPLLTSLRHEDYSVNEITDVVFTHLHFDHFNGAIQNKDGQLSLTFPNANHWCSRRQWEHAYISNLREKVSYFNEFFSFLEQSGKLNLIDIEGNLFPGIGIRFFDGHTPGQIIPFIDSNGEIYVYVADFIPTAAHIPVLWIPAFDLYPVKVMNEKKQFLTEAVEKGYKLFFEHDFYTECATVLLENEKFTIREAFAL